MYAFDSIETKYFFLGPRTKLSCSVYTVRINMCNKTKLLLGQENQIYKKKKRRIQLNTYESQSASSFPSSSVVRSMLRCEIYTQKTVHRSKWRIYGEGGSFGMIFLLLNTRKYEQIIFCFSN